MRELLRLAGLAGGQLADAGLLERPTATELEQLQKCTASLLDAVEGAIGNDTKDGSGFAGPEERYVGMARGQFVEAAVAQVLVRAAKNGGMMRMQMDDDKRWRWVCREIADRNDRSVPKEKTD